MAKAVSPYIANQIGQVFKGNDFENSKNGNNELAGVGSPQHLLAHAILGAAVSYATGNDALTGGLGASAGEGTALIILSKYIYKVDNPSELTAEQKDTISSIASLAGLALGASTGNVTDAVNVGETAKVAVEDNGMGGDQIGMRRKTNAELAKETWEMIHGPLGKFLNKNQKYILIGTDFLPVLGDIKGYAEAEDTGDYIFASIGLVPLYGDALQKAHKAEKAYEKAKAAKDSEGMKKASQEAVNVLKSQGKASEVTASQIIKKVENGQNIKPVVNAQAGSKGNWDRSVNKPTFEPNKQYKLSNGHSYHTDSMGRVNKVEGQLSLNKMDRNTYQQGKAGKAENATGDDGGHLIASTLGGAGDRINMVPQTSTLNRGDWKRMEDKLKQEVKAGKTVSVKIEVGYSTNGSKRPNYFKVTPTIDGKPNRPFEFEQ